jgi:hypothetical protein
MTDRPLCRSRPFSKTAEEGAQTQLHCCLGPLEELEPGGYYADCHPGSISAHAANGALATKLWDVSVEQVAAAGASADGKADSPAQKKDD